MIIFLNTWKGMDQWQHTYGMFEGDIKADIDESDIIGSKGSKTLRYRHYGTKLTWNRWKQVFIK